MSRFLYVCLGGAAGTGARYLLSGWVLRWGGSGFPWGTLAVNVLGSFLLSLIMSVALATDLFSPTLRLTLTVGVMGGFTTYSTFNYETLQSLERGDWLLGGANLAMTVVGCLVAGLLGAALGRGLTGG